MHFTVADSSLEPHLRDLMRRITVPGAIEIAYCREPDFFDSLCTEGETHQVVAALEDGLPVGLGCRSIRQMYINGKPQNFGYLSALRALPSARSKTGLARGYRFLQSLHLDGKVPAYLSTIIEENAYAKKMLTSKRGGLPSYDDWGKMVSYVVPLKRRKQTFGSDAGIRVVSGGEVGLERIVEFINAYGQKRQFAPVWSSSGFGTGLTQGLCTDSFRVVLTGDKKIGAVAALWDQRQFRQTEVVAYSGLTSTLLPIINVALSLSGYYSLVKPGRVMNGVYVSMATSLDNDPEMLKQLLKNIYAEASGTGLQFFITGFHERNPLRAVMESFRSLKYYSRLYCVYWNDGAEWVNKLDRSMIPGVEIATL